MSFFIRPVESAPEFTPPPQEELVGGSLKSLLFTKQPHIIGLDYAHSYQKPAFNKFFARKALWIADRVGEATEKKIHGCVGGPDNYHADYRNGTWVIKVRTMHEVEDGQEEDINPNSHRIIENAPGEKFGADTARKVGADEMYQFYDVAAGFMDLFGHRGLKDDDIDKVATQASRGRIPSREIDKWVHLQKNETPGLIGRAAIMRHLPEYTWNTVECSVMTVNEENKYGYNQSLRGDYKELFVIGALMSKVIRVEAQKGISPQVAQNNISSELA